jgi:hypothetical protein
MRIRITREPFGSIDGISLRRYRLGTTYDIAPALAEYLVAAGFATIEMRQRQRSKRPRQRDRRTASHAYPASARRESNGL